MIECACVHMSICVSLSVCVLFCICVCDCVYTGVYPSVHVCVCDCMHVYRHAHIQACRCLCEAGCMECVCVHVVCVCAAHTRYRRMASRAGSALRPRMTQEKVAEGSEGSGLSDCKFQLCVLNIFYFLSEIHMNM